MSYQLGCQVVLIRTPCIHEGDVGRFAEIVGLAGREHCEGMDVYLLEFCEGYVIPMCECSFVNARNPRTVLGWGNSIWKPKRPTITVKYSLKYPKGGI